MRKWFFHREAAAEFDDAFEWYESSRPGWGNNFRREIEAVIARILSTPEAFVRILGNIRCVNAHQFPYAVCYRVRGDSIEILAVAHHHRDPDYWKSRIE
jgi:plasmid stabilization system protein ParE